MSFELFNQDCISKMMDLKKGSFDLVIADPPYGINYQSSSKTDRSKRHNKLKNDNLPFIWFLKQAYDLLKEDRPIVVFSSWLHQDIFKQAMLCAGFEIKSHVIWDRKTHGMGDLKSSFAPRHEIIWFGVKGKYKFQNGRPKSVLPYMSVSSASYNGDLPHPTMKPVPLLNEILEKLSKEGDLVLDPFMGSGSTGVSCVETNRNFVGIELDRDFFKYSKQRINESLGGLQGCWEVCDGK